jgi:nucleotide-binding universal stress UspA family protein
MTILVAYSADDYGRAALDYGVSEAVREGERIVVVNVTRGDALVDARFAGSSDVATVEGRLEALPIEAEFRQAMDSDVAGEILDVASAVDPRLLVVGVRRRTPMGKLIMGSIAQRLILDAPCPVVAVKPR